jgi:hypothetical protein
MSTVSDVSDGSPSDTEGAWSRLPPDCLPLLLDYGRNYPAAAMIAGR